MDLHRILDLKSNPMNSSHFENNLKRTINCPATRANMNEPNTQQGCGSGAEAILDAWSRSLKFGSWMHRDSLWGKRVMQIIQCFFIFLLSFDD